MATDIILKDDEIELVSNKLTSKSTTGGDQLRMIGPQLTIGDETKSTTASLTVRDKKGRTYIRSEYISTPKIFGDSINVSDISLGKVISESSGQTKPGVLHVKDEQGQPSISLEGAKGEVRMTGNLHANVLNTDNRQNRVGIATSRPSHTLHVNGEVAGRGSFLSLSDVRCKENINPITNSLPTLMKLQGVRFNWNNSELTGENPPKEPQIGFVAQEVDRILPEIVTKDDQGRHSVAYASLIPMLVEGIKEQENKIEALEIRLKKYAQENINLYKRLDDIENKMAH